jgi:hypothetical protein
MHPYMAVTAHFVKEKAEIRTLEARLIAFQHMPGSHDGQTLGQTFVDILERFNLTKKVGCITADNASNNGTMTEEIEKAMALREIPFSRTQNYIRYVLHFSSTLIILILNYHRCFPHTINLAVQDFLEAIKTLTSPNGISSEVFDALVNDPVKRCRELVNAARSTSQRREDFKRTVADAIKSGTFKGRELELLRDMPVRWSSTFNMIDRFLTMSEVSLTLVSFTALH